MTTKITVQQMRQCADAGMTLLEASEHLGVRPTMFRSAASILGVKYRHCDHRTTTDAMIRKCAALGMSVRQASDQLNVSESMLRSTASVLGISFHGRTGRAFNRVTLRRNAAHDPFGALAR